MRSKLHVLLSQRETRELKKDIHEAPIVEAISEDEEIGNHPIIEQPQNGHDMP